jgi:hypothetical protein
MQDEDDDEEDGGRRLGVSVGSQAQSADQGECKQQVSTPPFLSIHWHSDIDSPFDCDHSKLAALFFHTATKMWCLRIKDQFRETKES